MDDIMDELLHVAVGCREAGVTDEESLAVVRDVYAAPWSNDDMIAASPLRRIVERAFSRPLARVKA